MIQLRDKDKSGFERLLDFLPDSIVATDADGRILFANEQAARLFGYTQAELANQTVESLLPGKYETAHQNHRENYFAAPRTRSMGIGLELIGRKRDGTEFPVDISLSPVATKDGIMVLAAVRDHTLQKRAETEAAVRAAQQAVVAELVVLALQDMDIAALLKTVAERVPQTLGVEFSAVLELQPDGTSFVLRAGMGWEQDSAGSVIPASPDSMAGYTLLSRKLLTIADFSQETRFGRDPFPGLAGMASGISTLIGEGARPWGVLGVYSDRPRSFSLDDSHFVWTVANLLAVTIQRKIAETEIRQSRAQLQALAIRLQDVQEEEQRRIAREIHDEMGQALTVLKFDLAFILRQFAGAIDGAQREAFLSRVASMEESVGNIIKQMQNIAGSLRPTLLDDLGLDAAMQWFAEDFGTRTGIHVDLDLAGDVSLAEPRLGTAVFRIMQEALTNVARHAQATRVAVTMQVSEGALLLTVADNGRGVTGKELGRQDALGLLGMRERAESVGAQLIIEGVPGQGTTVRLRVPMAP
jgi:PAS domain S-box-containing protein